MDVTAFAKGKAEVFWQKANSFFDWAYALFGSIPILLGLGLCRACLGWMFEATKASPVMEGSESLLSLMAMGIGQFMGCLCLMVVLLRIKTWTAHAPALLGISLGCIVLGATSLFVAQEQPVAIPVIGRVLAGMGYAMLCSLWIELYGLFTPKKFLLAFSLSYLVNLALWFFMNALIPVASYIVCLLSAFLSCVMLVAGYRSRQATSKPVCKPSLKNFPWMVFAWVLAFSFAYSVADSVTGLGHTSLPSKLGMAIPCVITIVGICLLSKRFSSKAFLLFAFLLMCIGLGSTFFTATPHWLSQLALSAAMEAQTIMIMVVACQCARQGRSSAAFFFCLLHAASSFSSRLMPLPVFANLDEAGQTMLWALSILLVVFAGISLFATKFFASSTWFEKTTNPSGSALTAFVERYGLTQRETTILALLTEGRSYEEIAEELFIAQGTVRAHAGHIFEKTGTHSRWELEQLQSKDLM